MARGNRLINEEVKACQITQIKHFLCSQRELNLRLLRYQLDVLSTELWETRSEQGHKLGSYGTYGLLTTRLHNVKMITVNYKKWNVDLAKSEWMKKWMQLGLSKCAIYRTWDNFLDSLKFVICIIAFLYLYFTSCIIKCGFLLAEEWKN